jgi:hypothetical protein
MWFGWIFRANGVGLPYPSGGCILPTIASNNGYGQVAFIAVPRVLASATQGCCYFSILSHQQSQNDRHEGHRSKESRPACVATEPTGSSELGVQQLDPDLDKECCGMVDLCHVLSIHASSNTMGTYTPSHAPLEGITSLSPVSSFAPLIVLEHCQKTLGHF